MSRAGRPHHLIPEVEAGCRPLRTWCDSSAGKSYRLWASARIVGYRERSTACSALRGSERYRDGASRAGCKCRAAGIGFTEISRRSNGRNVHRGGAVVAELYLMSGASRSHHLISKTYVGRRPLRSRRGKNGDVTCRRMRIGLTVAVGHRQRSRVSSRGGISHAAGICKIAGTRIAARKGPGVSGDGPIRAGART